MLRSVLARGASVARAATKCQTIKPVPVVSIQKACISSKYAQESGDTSTDFLNMLSHPDLDGYDLRSVFQHMNLLDYIPDTPVIEALLRACRKTNDYALTIRIQEAIRYRCGRDEKLYNSLMDPLKPVFDELGILTIQEMGYNKPEMFVEDVFDIH